MDYARFTQLMLKYYSLMMVKFLTTNRLKPSYKKMLLFKKAHKIPLEFWENVRANLKNIPPRGRKKKKKPEKA